MILFLMVSVPNYIKTAGKANVLSNPHISFNMGMKQTCTKGTVSFVYLLTAARMRIISVIQAATETITIINVMSVSNEVPAE